MNESIDLRSVTPLLREKVPSLLAVYVYGSAASGVVRADSDVDLGVLAERPLEEELLRSLAMELENLIGRDVDLVDLGRTTPVLLMQVLEGKLLFCSDARRVSEFENMAMSSYCALNEERKEILQDIAARGTVYARRRHSRQSGED